LNYLWSPWRMAYIENYNEEAACVFCKALTQPDGTDNLIVFRGHRAFVILNRFPYTSGHLMAVPNDHQPSLELLEVETRAEMLELATYAIQVLKRVYHPQGFNLGINIGEIAGAGITDHVHLHIVPRWSGDTNFMSSLGQTRVLPESLDVTYHRIHENWRRPKNKSQDQG
jgi:ATP adenylyltransferase